MSDVSLFESVPPTRSLPKELRPELLYLLRVIARPLIDQGKAAPWNYVLDHCEDANLDAQVLLNSLPRVGASGTSYGFTSPGTTHMNETDEIRVTMAASLVLPELRVKIGDPFQLVVQHMVHLYQNRPWSLGAAERVPAVLRSNELAQTFPKLRPEFIAVLMDIFAYEPYIQFDRRGELQDGGWEWQIRRTIREFKDALTLEQYVERTCELTPEHTYAVPTALTATSLSPIARLGALDLLAPTLPVQSAPAESTRPVYVKEDLIAELEALDTDALHTDKLVQVLRELNFNFTHGQALSCNSLLRIALDTVPPAFGVTGFAQVAANYPWGKTDKNLLKKLVEFKDQGDDVMHRQIGPRRSRIDMHDMPAPIALNNMLDGLVVRLKELQKAATAP